MNIGQISEETLPDAIALFNNSLSESYSIYTYRTFLQTCPSVSLIATIDSQTVGAIICKLDKHNMSRRGYIGMLAVLPAHQRLGIASTLVKHAIQQMKRNNADEVVLETEVCNTNALALYERLGFVRDKLMHKYYMNGSDAYRLKLWLR